MLHWTIIYPRGDRTRLDIVQVRDYERDEWDIASQQEFDNTSEGESEAREHMVRLAKRNGLRYPGQRAYLD